MPDLFQPSANNNFDGKKDNNPITNEDKLITVALMLFSIFGFILLFYFFSSN
ncbi:MAG: hypothetical protein AAB487_02035 [Patescibacteria group bacterium]